MSDNDGDVKVIRIALQLTFEKEEGKIPPMVMKDLEALRDVIVTHLREHMTRMDFLMDAADRQVINEDVVDRLWERWLVWLGDVECQNIREY